MNITSNIRKIKNFFINDFVFPFWELFLILVFLFCVPFQSSHDVFTSYSLTILAFAFLSLFLKRKVAFTIVIFISSLYFIATYNSQLFLFRPLNIADIKLISLFLNVDGLGDPAQFFLSRVPLSITADFFGTLLLYFTIPFIIKKCRRIKKQTKEINVKTALIFIIISLIYFHAISSEGIFYKLEHFFQDKGNFIENYSEDIGLEYSKYYKKELVEENKNLTKKSDVEKPNIIFILLESVIDPTKISSMEISPAASPFLHSLKEKSTYGKTLLGANHTASSEFELLFSIPFSMVNKYFGLLPYGEMTFKTGIPSIVSYLKTHGYNNIAYHSMSDTYYNRHHAYNAIGFEKFTSRTPDNSIFNLVLKSLQDSTSPQFAHIITYGPHGPYRSSNENFSIKADIDPREIERLNTYFNRLKKLDNELKNFITAIDTLPERTIIVLYSDHLPRIESLYGEKQALFYIIYDSKNPKKEETAAVYLHTLTKTVLEKAGLPLRAIDFMPYSEETEELYKELYFDIIYGEMYLKEMFE